MDDHGCSKCISYVPLDILGEQGTVIGKHWNWLLPVRVSTNSLVTLDIPGWSMDAFLSPLWVSAGRFSGTPGSSMDTSLPAPCHVRVSSDSQETPVDYPWIPGFLSPLMSEYMQITWKFWTSLDHPWIPDFLYAPLSEYSQIPWKLRTFLDHPMPGFLHPYIGKFPGNSGHPLIIYGGLASYHPLLSEYL